MKVNGENMEEIIPVTTSVVSDWMCDRLQNTLGPTEFMILVGLFGGERLACCDEAVMLQVNGEIVALATIAPRGEGSSPWLEKARKWAGKRSIPYQPEIIGLYVTPSERGKGYGRRVFVAAVERCIQRRLATKRLIRVTVLSLGTRRIIDALPEHLRHRIGDIDFSVSGMGYPLDLSQNFQHPP